MSEFKVLILGSGGREHAFAWSLLKERSIKKIYCAPGNGGTDLIASNISIDINDPNEVLKFVEKHDIDLTIVGPEKPLKEGIVDIFNNSNRMIFGPTKFAAQLETSKVFSRTLMQKCDVLQPNFNICHNIKEVEKIKEKNGLPLVLKVDGLAAGKGAFVCEKEIEYQDAINDIYKLNKFGDAANKILVEECLIGDELSVFAICDGMDLKIINTAQDHKRVNDGDKGPNTGGMGAYSPTPLSTKKLIENVKDNIYKPVLQKMIELGHPFRGFLYAGIMLVNNKPYVIEFNVRMGDPETQVVLPLLESSLFELLYNTVNNKLLETKLTVSSKTAVTVVLSSNGYPSYYKKGQVIKIDNKNTSNCIHFHAGTTNNEGVITVNGGRVLNVVGFGNNLKSAIDNTYNEIDNIYFEGMYYRNDIGRKGLNHSINSSGGNG